MKKILMILLLLICISGVYGEIQNIGRTGRNDCITLRQAYENSTYTNVTSITYPNQTTINPNYAMIKNGGDYKYVFCDTSQIGNYEYCTSTDVDGTPTIVCIGFDVTESGDAFDSSQAIMVIAQVFIIALFLVLGFSFSKEKWKIRSLFFMGSLLMGVITLNSIRIIAGTSAKLSLMGNTGLILGIVILSAMFMYLLIFYTIEMFKYFKDKRKMKWEVNNKY